MVSRLAAVAVAMLAALQHVRAQAPADGLFVEQRAGMRANLQVLGRITLELQGRQLASAVYVPSGLVVRLDDACNGRGRPPAGFEFVANERPSVFLMFDHQTPRALWLGTPPKSLIEALRPMPAMPPALLRRGFDWSFGLRATTPDATLPRESRPRAWPLQTVPAADPAVLVGWFAGFEDVATVAKLPQPAMDLAVSMLPIATPLEIEATITQEHRDAEGWHRDQATVRGAICADGRFVLRVTADYEGEGVTRAVETIAAFDHAALYLGQSGGHTLSAYPVTHPRFADLLTMAAGEAVPLLEWARGPLFVPLWSGAAWRSESARIELDGRPADLEKIVETYTVEPLMGRCEYFAERTGNRLRVRRLDVVPEPNSGPRMRREFADHQRFAAVGERPATMVTTWFDPATNEPDRRITLRIARAAPSRGTTWRPEASDDQLRRFR